MSLHSLSRPTESGREHRAMRLKNYAMGEWVEGTGKATDLFHAVTGE